MEEYTIEDLKLNKFKLDEEASKQSSLYQYFTDKLTEVRALKDEISLKLEEKLAEVELNIRNNPPDGLKITESVIQALVVNNEEIKELRKRLNEIKKQNYELEGIVNSLDQKKSMIKVLTELYIVGYYRVDNFSSVKYNWKIECNKWIKDEQNDNKVQDEIRKRLNKKEE